MTSKHRYQTVNEMLRAAAAGVEIPQAEIARLARPIVAFNPQVGTDHPSYQTPEEAAIYWKLLARVDKSAVRAAEDAELAENERKVAEMLGRFPTGSIGQDWFDERE